MLDITQIIITHYLLVRTPPKSGPMMPMRMMAMGINRAILCWRRVANDSRAAGRWKTREETAAHRNTPYHISAQAQTHKMSAVACVHFIKYSLHLICCTTLSHRRQVTNFELSAKPVWCLGSVQGEQYVDCIAIMYNQQPQQFTHKPHYCTMLLTIGKKRKALLPWSLIIRP